MPLDDYYPTTIFDTTLRMMPDDPNWPIVIVEGFSDKDLLYRFMNARFHVIPRTLRNHKNAVMAAGKKLKKLGKRAYIGIVDRDFDCINSVLKHGFREGVGKFRKMERMHQKRNVFFTDSHDLDVDVFSIASGEVIYRFRDRNRMIAALKQRGIQTGMPLSELLREINDLVIDESLKAGVVRLVLFRSGLKQEIDIEAACSSKYQVDFHGILKDHANSEATYENLIEEYENLREQIVKQLPDDAWQQVANGHDLITLLAIGLCGVFGSKHTSFMDEIWSVLQATCDSMNFRKLELCRNLEDWAERTGVRLFRWQ